jgi:fatty-acyl-CoA synthase
MIRFPEVIEPGRNPFSGTVLQDWIDAANVFDALSERADMQPDVTALTFVQTGDPGEEVRRVSYRELLASIAQAANLFRSLGVTRNDGVAYMLPALVETQFVLWGAETAGFAVPINFLLQPQQIAELMTAANVKAFRNHPFRSGPARCTERVAQPSA